MQYYVPPGQRKKFKVTSLLKLSTVLFAFVFLSCSYILLSPYNFFLSKPVQAETRKEIARTEISDQVVAAAASGQQITTVALVRITVAIQNIPLERNWPIRGRITTYYSSFHPAIDIAVPSGTPIHPYSSGIVTVARYGGSFGNYITIVHSGGFETTYAHLSKILVKPGDQVNLSTVIGLVGSTGNSTGPHLHFQVIQNGFFVNPLAVLN